MRATMFKSLVVLICVTCASVSNANDGKNILLGIIGAAMKKSQERAQQEAANAQLPPGMMPTEASAQSDQLPEWPTKAAFIEAAKRGEMSGIKRSMFDFDNRMQSIGESVKYILANEYQTPIPGDFDCQRRGVEEANDLLALISELHMGTLSDKEPFFQGVSEPYLLEAVQERVKNIGTGYGQCTMKTVLGVIKPYPYGKSLLNLANEYGEATKYYVEQVRAERIAEYEERQRQLLVEAQRNAEANVQREAAVRAAEEKRIKAERARVEAEEQRRQQVKRSRIAG